MSGSGLLAASNRKRVIIIASAVLVFLLFVTFRPSTPKWTSSSGSKATPNTETSTDQQKLSPAVAEGPPQRPSSQPSPPPQVQHGSDYDAEKEAEAVALSKSAAAAKPSATPSVVVPPATGGSSDSEFCKTHAKTSDMLVVMKTGATEAYEKLPIHFLTTLRCANDTVIFSDVEMEMGGHHLINVLEDVKPDIKKDNGDFQLYDLLQQYRAIYADPRSLRSGGNGWNLDKYKFNHMMLKTWKYRQDVDWYVFIEADTYLLWDNLRTLLDKYDPNKPYYMGSPTYLDIEFAHGGTGYVISRAAMKTAVGGHPDIADKYDKDMATICCGDRQPARILLDEDIKLTKTWPMFNGEKPLTLPYGNDHWCQPIITMHHMTPQEISQVWTYEQYRKANNIKGPVMIKDIYEHFVRENLDNLNPPIRNDWDNFSHDLYYKPQGGINPGLNEGQEFSELPELKRQSVENPANCEKLCSSQDECFGWMHKDNECHLGRSIKIGGPMSPDNGKQFVSGWNMKNVNDFIKRMQDCPKGPDWSVRGI